MKNNNGSRPAQYTYIILMFIASAYIAYQAWGYSLGYEHKTHQLTEQLDMQGNFKTVSKRVFEAVTFSWYDGYTEQLEDLQTLKKEGEDYRTGYIIYLIIFAAMLLFGLMFYLYSKSHHALFAFLLMSVVSLIVGLYAPILAIVAYEDVPVLGQTVFQYESKSILTALYKLFENGQWVIAGVILLFTVIMPVLKSLLMALIIYSRKLHFSRYSIQMLKNIGKWSMLDVFVIAILVTYFSTKQTGATDASLEPGVYFFTMYVLSSMIISFFIYRHTETDTQPVPQAG